ncbi:MAG: hypothetical protein DCC75_04715 [Proteobacteria bacterium]|nr:MAG: hypothetical protein DCC75_04715 [Pseudomonadota bacterium]
MSIDFLFELERSIDGGKEIYACPGLGRNQWVIGKSAEDLKKQAQRSADSKKMPVQIVKLISKQDAVAGDMYLVPTQIGDPGARGEPNIQWSVMETKEAADNMKDVRKGPAPFFGMQLQETIQPVGG